MAGDWHSVASQFGGGRNESVLTAHPAGGRLLGQVGLRSDFTAWAIIDIVITYRNLPIAGRPFHPEWILAVSRAVEHTEGPGVRNILGVFCGCA